MSTSKKSEENSRIEALEKENKSLKEEIKRLQKANQSSDDILQSVKAIHEDLKSRYFRLDELVHNPGLQHIALLIFKNLDAQSLGSCRAVSKG